MGPREHVPLRRLGEVPLSYFISDLFETSWRRTDGTSPLRPLETSLRHSNKAPRRRTTETSLGVSVETYLRRRWNKQRDVVTMSPQRFYVGWLLTIQTSYF